MTISISKENIRPIHFFPTYTLNNTCDISFPEQHQEAFPSGVSMFLNFFAGNKDTPSLHTEFRSLLFEHRHLWLTLLLPTPLCKRLEGKVGTSPNY